MHAHHVPAGHYPGCIDPTDCWCEVQRLSRVLLITGVILVMQVVGGVLSGSLALLADAGHVFGDSLAIVVTLATAVLVKLGYGREQTRRLAFRINVTLLFVIAGWIVYEAVGRINAPREIDSPIMVVVAALGGVGNYLQHRVLENAAEEHKHHAHHSLSLHVLSDLLQSVAVVVGGVVIWMTDYVLIDPLLSFVIAVWIAYRTIKLIRNPDGGTCHHH